VTLYKMPPAIKKHPRWTQLAWGEPASHGLWRLMSWMLHESWTESWAESWTEGWTEGWTEHDHWFTCEMVT